MDAPAAIPTNGLIEADRQTTDLRESPQPTYHDDVMDEPETRRGVETVNARWGNVHAILASDESPYCIPQGGTSIETTNTVEVAMFTKLSGHVSHMVLVVGIVVVVVFLLGAGAGGALALALLACTAMMVALAWIAVRPTRLGAVHPFPTERPSPHRDDQVGLR